MKCKSRKAKNWEIEDVAVRLEHAEETNYGKQFEEEVRRVEEDFPLATGF